MPLKVLIIEDEILILKSLQIVFEKLGHTVETATLGKQALEKILSNDYNIIITDLMLNDITGFDILEGSLKRFQRDDLPSRFVIMSAYSSEQIINRAKEYNCLFLSKPFDNIHKTVENIIERFKDEN